MIPSKAKLSAPTDFTSQQLLLAIHFAVNTGFLAFAPMKLANAYVSMDVVVVPSLLITALLFLRPLFLVAFAISSGASIALLLQHFGAERRLGDYYRWLISVLFRFVFRVDPQENRPIMLKGLSRTAWLLSLTCALVVFSALRPSFGFPQRPRLLAPGTWSFVPEHARLRSPVSFARFGASSDDDSCVERTKFPAALRAAVKNLMGFSGLRLRPSSKDIVCLAQNACRRFSFDEYIRLDPGAKTPAESAAVAVEPCRTEADYANALAKDSRVAELQSRRLTSIVKERLRGMSGEWCGRAVADGGSHPIELRVLFRENEAAIVGSAILAEPSFVDGPVGEDGHVRRLELYPVSESAEEIILREVSRTHSGANWFLSKRMNTLYEQLTNHRYNLSHSCEGYWQPTDWPHTS